MVPVRQIGQVWLLTSGDGSDGSEWQVHGIYSTWESATRAKAEYEKPQYRNDGSTYHYDAQVEDWDVQE